MSPITNSETPIADRARDLAPVVWLIGKVQSGKTSIIRQLTQADEAEIGTGFRACTRSARVFDFPPEAPIIRFLDTRGLGEADYDAQEDIAFCEARAHLILAVLKALDPAQASVIETIRAAKRRHPEWPVVVAQTNLHEAYVSGQGHVLPYPFRTEGSLERVSDPLVRSLTYQRSLFADLVSGPESFVPIDFTQPGDGYDPVDYGRDALLDALVEAAPAAVSVALDELPRVPNPTALEASNARILGFALAAGAADVLPFVGVVTVPAVQAAMLRQLAELHGVKWDKRAYSEFAGALGAGTLVRTASAFGIRQLVKLIPVYGQTAGAVAAASASFAATYALGKAVRIFLVRREHGVQSGEIASVYRSALREAFNLAKEGKVGAAAAGGKS